MASPTGFVPCATSIIESSLVTAGPLLCPVPSSLHRTNAVRKRMIDSGLVHRMTPPANCHRYVPIEDLRDATLSPDPPGIVEQHVHAIGARD